MLIMRLQRIGKKGQAYFRLVVTEHTKKPQGKFLELLGSYDPHKKVLQAKKERIEYWQSQGVQMSSTLNNLLINHKVISGKKKVSWKPKRSGKSKAQNAKQIQEIGNKSETEKETIEETESPKVE